MFVLAALIYYLPSVSSISAQAPTLFDVSNTRTLRDIIVSCLTTTFTCTWVSLHPNISAPEPEDLSLWEGTKKTIRRFCRRGLIPFVVALLFPEYIVGCAIRQRLVAGEYVRMINENTDGKKIKMIHAFFIIMGGVHKKAENGNGSYPLDRYQVAGLLGVDLKRVDVNGLDVDEAKPEEKLERITLPSEGELKDKSKSDSLAKLLVLIQTLWFIIQCAARGIEHLPITGLEVITLAYAVLNFAIYLAWWNKPNRVDYPIVVTADVKPERKKDKESRFWLPILSMLGNQDDIEHINNHKEVSNFFSGDPQDSHYSMASLISFFLGSAFGALHCIDWNLAFSGVMEQKIWKISTLFLVGAPFTAILLISAWYFLGNTKNILETIAFIIAGLVLVASPFLIFGYLAARIATIYVAFHSLRFLPPEAFVDIQWTKSIPHFW